MSATDEAHAEAERRYPSWVHRDLHHAGYWAFRGGAEWQASRPFTEEDVEVAAKVIYENERETIDGAQDWPAWDDCREESRKSVLADARAALAAVTAHRNPRTGDSGAAR